MKKLMVLLLGVLAFSSVQADVFIEDQIQYGDKWPFTVEQVTLGCDRGLPYVSTAGKRYALTGAGMQRWPKVTPIHIVGKSIGPFTEIALKACKK